MAASGKLYCSLLLIGVVAVVCGNEDMRDAINQISQLQADLFERIVPSYIQNQVEEALTRILGDQSIYERVRHLKHSQQQMKRHIHRMARRLKTVEDYGKERRETIVKLQEEHAKCEVRIEDIQREVNSSQLHVSTVYIELKQKAKSAQFKLYDVEDNYSKIVTNLTLLTKVVANSMERRLKTLEDGREEKMKTIVRLEKEHGKCEVRMTDLQREVNSSQLHVSYVNSEINSTKFKLNDIENNYAKIFNNVTSLTKLVDNKMDNISRYCTCVEETMSSTDTSLTYPPTPVTTVTPRVVEKMNRILVIQRASSTVQYPHQIDLHSNEMSTYTYLQTSRIRGITYDPISRRIIFSRYDPNGIYSSRLDVGGVETLRLNVKAYDIVIDADRGIMFLATYHPRWTISRMTTIGNDFRGIVDLTDYSPSNSPRGIAIDGRQKVIYFCVRDRLSAVDYDGKNLRTLHTNGNDINTVVFDKVKNSIFFNVNKKVMMKSLTTNRNTKIMELSYGIRNFVLYNNSLYISGYNAGNIDVIHLENNVHFNLRNMEHKNNGIMIVP